MTVVLADSASLHQGSNFKAYKEIIDFALNVNVCLRL